MNLRLWILVFLLLPFFLFVSTPIDVPEKTEQVTYDASGKSVIIITSRNRINILDRNSQNVLFSLDLKTSISLNSVRKNIILEILQAPGTIIENQVFDGITLSLRDSPSSSIQNNTFINIESSSTIRAIKISSSPDTIVIGNLINEVTLANQDFESRSTFLSVAIEVDSSENVLVAENSISNIRASAQPLARTLTIGVRVVFSNFITIRKNNFANLSSSVAVNRIFAIYLFKSNNSVIIENTIENLFGYNQQFSTYVAAFYIETSLNQTISQNQVGNLNSRGTSISTGIRLFNVQQVEISENDIRLIIAGQNAYGMYFTRVNIGNVENNYLENISSIGGIETTAFNLEDTNLITIQENHAVFVDRLVSLIGSSGQNLIFNNVLNDIPIGNEDVGPIISPHSDIQYSANSNDTYVISWVVLDSDPATYQIFKNGIPFDEGPWQSGVPIIVDVSGLEEGDYNFTLLVRDTQGNVAQDTVFVFVTPYNLLSEGVDYIRKFEKDLTVENFINLTPYMLAIYIGLELVRAQLRAQKKKKLLKQKELHEKFKKMKNNPGTLIDNIFKNNLEDNK